MAKISGKLPTNEHSLLLLFLTAKYFRLNHVENFILAAILKGIFTDFFEHLVGKKKKLSIHSLDHLGRVFSHVKGISHSCVNTDL